MKYVYECKRINIVPDYRENNEEYMNWKEISAELIETIVGVMTPLTKIVGYFEPERTTERLLEELEAGNTIVLTNFYVRRRVA